MDKIKNLMNKPITWGGYTKLCGVCMLFSTIYSGAMYVSLCQPDWWVDFKEKITRNHTEK